MQRSSSAFRARLVALLAFSLSTPCGLARAEEPSVEARAHALFQQGIEAVQRGELTQAAERFEAAQALSPNPIVLYNLGQTYSALGWPVQAENALRLYLASNAAATDPKRIAEVEELLEFNVRRIGAVVVELVPKDAALEVDGSPLALTPSGRIRLAAGRHVLVATRTNYKPTFANVDVLPSQEIRTRLELEPLPAQRAVAPAPPATEPSLPGSETGSGDSAPHSEHAPPTSPGMSTQRVLGLTMAGAGGVAIALGTIFGLETIRLKNASNRDNHCDGTGCDSEGLRLRSAAVHDGHWATGLFIGGAVAVAVGLTLYFLDAAPPPSRAASSFGHSAWPGPTRSPSPDLALQF
jgi:hypothetical protein